MGTAKSQSRVRVDDSDHTKGTKIIYGGWTDSQRKKASALGKRCEDLTQRELKTPLETLLKEKQ